jgi:hypothetical protein
MSLIIISNTAAILNVPPTAESLFLINVLLLLSLLIEKELATVAGGQRAKRLSQALNVAIVPMLILFTLIVFTKIVKILR